MSLQMSYDYTDQLKSVLVENDLIIDISKKFKEITDNSERVKFCE